MSTAWHRPQRAEVIEPRLTFRENVVMALGLVGVIIAIRLWRLLPK